MGTLQKAIKKKSGAFSTLMELCIEEGSKQDVDDVSRACRMGKVVCVCVQYLSPPAFNPHSILACTLRLLQLSSTLASLLMA